MWRSPKLYDIEVDGEICVCRCCCNGQYWASWAALIHRLCGVSILHPPSPTQTIVMCIGLYTKHALWPSIESDIWMSTSELFLFLFDTLTCIYPFVFLFLLLSCVYRMALSKFTDAPSHVLWMLPRSVVGCYDMRWFY